MKASLKTLFVVLIGLSALLTARCSLDNLAGGSGAGNPGGSVTVALRAEISLGMAKSAAKTAMLTLDNTQSSSIVVTDQDGLAITLYEMYLTINDFRFMLDPDENPEKIFTDMHNRSPLLSFGRNCLVLTGGPYSCNGLTGEVEPNIGMIHLPVAKYTGIMLSLNRDQSKVFSSFSSRGQLFLSGTFTYYGRPHKIIVDIDRGFSPIFNFAGGIFTLSAKDTTHVELRFDAADWFRSIDIKKAIDRGSLQFNEYGNVVIGGCYGDNATQEMELAIQNSFIASGKLVLY
jgi:hypothetical protein